jgi:hypothetical protein
MIFERRVYTFRPGKLDAFWDAQGAWNTDEVFGPILAHNIGYFSTAAGENDLAIHLYRFDSLDQWQAMYGQYYQAQSPEYFALVRPWMLRQENAFLTVPPAAGVRRMLDRPEAAGAAFPASLSSAREGLRTGDRDRFPAGRPTRLLAGA